MANSNTWRNNVDITSMIATCHMCNALFINKFPLKKDIPVDLIN